MKKIIAAAFVTSLCAGAQADVGGFIGLTYAFGSNMGVGFTVQATSTRRENRGIVAGGVSLFPFAPTPAFGIPVGIGYQGQNAAVIGSYDLWLKRFAASGGFVDTRDDGHRALPPPRQIFN